MYKYRLIHGHFHPSRTNMGRGMITRPIWKCPCIKLFITYFRHLEKRHPYWPETKSRPILARASIWKCSCSNPITGYFPGGVKIWTVYFWSYWSYKNAFIWTKYVINSNKYFLYYVQRKIIVQIYLNISNLYNRIHDIKPCCRSKICITI